MAQPIDELMSCTLNAQANAPPSAALPFVGSLPRLPVSRLAPIPTEVLDTGTLSIPISCESPPAWRRVSPTTRATPYPTSYSAGYAQPTYVRVESMNDPVSIQSGHDASDVSSALAVSNAATSRQLNVVAPEPPKSRPRHTRSERIDLLWADASARTHLETAKLIPPPSTERSLEQRLVDEEPPETSDELLRALGRGELFSAPEALAAYEGALDAHRPRTLALVAGQLEMSFDPIEALRATLGVATPFVPGNERLKEACAAASEALSANAGLLPGVAASHKKRVEEALRQAVRGATDSIEAVVDHALIEARSFARRRVFGGTFVRATLTHRGGRESVTVYIPEAALEELPLLRTFPVSLAVEVRPPQDGNEPYEVAYRALALGRVVEIGYGRGRC